MHGLESLNWINEAALVTVVLALMVMGAETGRWYGQRRAADGRVGDALLVIVSAQLAILGLLLAFTFSAASSRFEARSDLVVAEAEAIESSFLRAQALPDDSRDQVLRLLRRYVDARLEFYYAGEDAARLGKAQHATAELQDIIWRMVLSSVQRQPNSPLAPVVLDHLDGAFRLSEERAAALRSHVPSAVVALLLVVSVLSMTAVGYTSGLAREGRRFSLITLCLIVAAVLYVIVDLDRPREGAIRISQRSLIVVRDAMESHLRSR